MEYIHTACPRNCYSTCSFIVGVENNKIKEIRPQPLNRATPEGICLKGLSYIERANSDQRILFPLLRQKRSFKRISWQTALNILAEKLNYCKTKFGSHSILFYSASGMSGMLNEISYNFWKLFGGVTTVYGNLCWPAGLEATRLVLGENKHNAPWDLENAKLIVLWGKNPAETNIQQMIPIEKAQSKGAKLIVIDPRRSTSAERANILVQPRPGTDGILALAISKQLIESGNIDKEFIDKNVRGFDEFAQSLQELDLEYAASISGIPIKMIHKLANIISNTSPMTIVPGYGMQRYTNGGQTIRCILALQVITGNIGKPGGGWHYANLQSYIFDKVKEPESYYPNSEKDLPFRRSISTARLGESMLAQHSPELKMIWVERGNPLTQNPDTNFVRKAFNKLEFRVVVEQFMTDTAKEADLILPAKNMFEQTDIIGSYWNPYVQLKPKVIEPAGEVKPETEIYWLLAYKLGLPEKEIKKNIPNPNSCSIEQWLNQKIACFPEITWEKLRRGPVLADSYEEIAFKDMQFKTPSGKIELYSDKATEIWKVPPLPTFEPLKEGPRIKPQEFPLVLLSPNTKNRIHSQFGNLNIINSIEGLPKVFISTFDAIKRSINNGNKVRVYNSRGELFVICQIDNSLRPGCVAIYNGIWNQEGANPNILSKGRETDMGYGTAFHDNMVEIEKIPE